MHFVKDKPPEEQRDFLSNGKTEAISGHTPNAQKSVRVVSLLVCTLQLHSTMIESLKNNKNNNFLMKKTRNVKLVHTSARV